MPFSISRLQNKNCLAEYAVPISWRTTDEFFLRVLSESACIGFELMLVCHKLKKHSVGGM